MELVAYYCGRLILFDCYGAAIIDVWIAPLLWLGEVELHYWIARKRKEPKQVLFKLWKGMHYGIKWILIQYLVFLILALVILIPTGRDLVFSFGRGGSPAYNADTGLLVAIPLYTFLFACWHSFFPNMKQCWTYIVPWAMIMLLAYLHVVHIRDWYFQIITVDDYMLGMWLAPAFGVVIQTPLLLLCFLIRNLWQKKAIHR
jgi:hypothetical protein